MSRYTESQAIIAEVHKGLPDDISLADRKKAIAAAYPFGLRMYHPYKMWCKAQSEYLARYSTPDNDKKHADWRDEMRAKGFAFAGDAA